MATRLNLSMNRLQYYKVEHPLIPVGPGIFNTLSCFEKCFPRISLMKNVCRYISYAPNICINVCKELLEYGPLTLGHQNMKHNGLSTSSNHACSTQSVIMVITLFWTFFSINRWQNICIATEPPYFRITYKETTGHLIN